MSVIDSTDEEYFKKICHLKYSSTLASRLFCSCLISSLVLFIFAWKTSRAFCFFSGARPLLSNSSYLKLEMTWTLNNKSKICYFIMINKNPYFLQYATNTATIGHVRWRVVQPKKKPPKQTLFIKNPIIVTSLWTVLSIIYTYQIELLSPWLWLVFACPAKVWLGEVLLLPCWLSFSNISSVSLL